MDGIVSEGLRINPMENRFRQKGKMAKAQRISLNSLQLLGSMVLQSGKYDSPLE